MGTGIYAIANLGTVRLYVGQVTHLKTRWPKMMAQLDDGKFPNPIVQSAWETHKAERRFTFTQLKICRQMPTSMAKSSF